MFERQAHRETPKERKERLRRRQSVALEATLAMSDHGFSATRNRMAVCNKALA